VLAQTTAKMSGNFSRGTVSNPDRSEHK